MFWCKDIYYLDVDKHREHKESGSFGCPVREVLMAETLGSVEDYLRNIQLVENLEQNEIDL